VLRNGRKGKEQPISSVEGKKELTIGRDRDNGLRFPKEKTVRRKGKKKKRAMRGTLPKGMEVTGTDWSYRKKGGYAAGGSKRQSKMSR